LEELRLGVVETHFADIVWNHAPLSSGELVKRCEEELSWKKSTTYTVLRKLCDRGLFRNQDGVVTVQITREEYHAMQSEQFVETTFHGSLPAFVAAFTARKQLSEAEIQELQGIIDSYRRDQNA